MLVSAIGGIFLLYLVNFIMSFFGSTLSFITSNSPMSIGISFIIVGVAALSLVLDFDFIEEGAEKGLPKYQSHIIYECAEQWVAAGNLNCDGIIKHFLSYYGGYNAENY